MSKDPAFLFYHQDFFTGVSDMTNEETGAYIKCMCIQASKNGISEKHMSIICQSQEIHNLIKSKFVLNTDTNLFENIRLKNEIDKRKKYSESRSNNRKKGIKDKKENIIISESYDKHMENEDENENEIKDDSNLVFKNTLLKNEKWKKSISTDFNISNEEVESKLEIFQKHLFDEQKFHPSMNAFAKHFKYWLPVNKSKNEKSTNNTRSNTNTGYKPASVDREKLLRELATDVENGNIPGDYSQKRTGS